jgi:hypothetical protein
LLMMRSNPDLVAFLLAVDKWELLEMKTTGS